MFSAFKDYEIAEFTRLYNNNKHKGFRSIVNEILISHDEQRSLFRREKSDKQCVFLRNSTQNYPRIHFFAAFVNEPLVRQTSVAIQLDIETEPDGSISAKSL